MKDSSKNNMSFFQKIISTYSQLILKNINSVKLYIYQKSIRPVFISTFVSNDNDELLLKSDDRYTLYPLKYNDVYQFYQNQEDQVWSEKEIHIQRDISDWRKLTDDEKHFIKRTLAFFASADGIVNENLALRFYNSIGMQEAKLFYGSQIHIEGIHQITYSLFIDTLIESQDEKNQLFDSVLSINSIKQKSNWFIKYTKDQNISLAKRLLVQAFMEGVAFASSFCSIFWLKDQGMMNSLCHANELISRDETLHQLFAVHLYNNYIKNKLSQDEVHNMYLEAMQAEENFVKDSLPQPLVGISSSSMIKYVRYMCNYNLQLLNYDKLYQENETNHPFKFMEKIGAYIKGNFFEVGVSEYYMSNPGQQNCLNDENINELKIEC